MGQRITTFLLSCYSFPNHELLASARDRKFVQLNVLAQASTSVTRFSKNKTKPQKNKTKNPTPNQTLSVVSLPDPELED